MDNIVPRSLERTGYNLPRCYESLRYPGRPAVLGSQTRGAVSSPRSRACCLHPHATRSAPMPGKPPLMSRNPLRFSRSRQRVSKFSTLSDRLQLIVDYIFPPLSSQNAPSDRRFQIPTYVIKQLRPHFIHQPGFRWTPASAGRQLVNSRWRGWSASPVSAISGFQLGASSLTFLNFFPRIHCAHLGIFSEGAVSSTISADGFRLACSYRTLASIPENPMLIFCVNR